MADIRVCTCSYALCGELYDERSRVFVVRPIAVVPMLKVRFRSMYGCPEFCMELAVFVSPDSSFVKPLTRIYSSGKRPYILRWVRRARFFMPM